MTKPPPVINRHRIAGYIAWALAVLAWVAMFMAAPRLATNARHMRRRRRYLALDRTARGVRDIILLRARELCAGPPPTVARFRNIPRGFTRRRSGGYLLRRVAGSWLRRRLKHRNPAERIALLVTALRNIDVFAARVAHRMRRYFTRLSPLIAAAPCAARLVSLAVLSVTAADSS